MARYYNDTPYFETGLEELLAFVEKDHNKLFHRDAKDQHPIEAITGLSEALENKVDVEEGKGLSTNDFTDELKEKLENSLEFEVEDVSNRQVLLYDKSSKKWKNYNFVDKYSIIYLEDDGLSLQGYEDAKQGQMLVKDNRLGLAWVDPLDDAKLQQYIILARAEADKAAANAITAGNYAADAMKAADYVDNKFWYGTMEEYNNLDTILKSTIYVILDQ